MKIVILALLTLCAGLLSAQDNNKKIEKTGAPVEAKFAPGGKIRMDLCPSGVDLTGSDDGTLKVSYQPEIDDVKVRVEIFGDRADLRITGCPHNNFKVAIQVPKSSGLYIRMMAGELNVRDIIGDKDVELHFGRLNMNVGDPAKYGRVEASVNSGDLQATAFNVSKGGLFRSFDQHGPGTYRLYAHVGAGELDLR